LSSASKKTPVTLKVHVWLMATIIPLFLKILPLEAILRLLTPRESFKAYEGVGRELIIETVNKRLQNPKNMKRRACLRKGLVLFHFLRLGGANAVLHFGVYAPSTQENRMHAHCWVTVDGTCVSAPPGEPAAEMLTHGAPGDGRVPPAR